MVAEVQAYWILPSLKGAIMARSAHRCVQGWQLHTSYELRLTPREKLFPRFSESGI